MTIDYKQFPAFQNLDEFQLQSFINACKGAIVPAGQPILRQNSQGQKIFFVLDGQVRVFLDTQTGEKELAKITAPTVLGEISFFSGEPNSANVTTVTSVRTLVMPFDELRQRLHQGDAAASIVVLNMAGAIAQRASAMTRKISELYNSQPQSELSELQRASKNLFGEWSFL